VGSIHRHGIHRPRKRPKIIEVVYQQLTQLGRTDSAVGKPLIYYCENSSSYSGRGAWSIYSMSMVSTSRWDPAMQNSTKRNLPSLCPSLPIPLSNQIKILHRENFLGWPSETILRLPLSDRIKFISILWISYLIPLSVSSFFYLSIILDRIHATRNTIQPENPDIQNSNDQPDSKGEKALNKKLY